ncbi:DTW domain containing 1, putative [Acanthamoeba castellanii str. Neff]|uniref:tRNA-uridine aminocarboxypropyltransferase 1 n=1 Tax=Acanthamoeba castellanii (strain ATCC 30010 / Neff) TaxID=1257118 RepID=L8GP32_ACACF|nr:DTW domain containing 1, putative [Acanthamoeba castellanii str. Neff]ELR13901.1 DTW domain containing 1, putative [Acanthamoeba castellanii str. Neff]
MELSAIMDETAKGKKRSIDEVVQEEEKKVEEVGEKEEKPEDSTDNPLLNLKFSANQSILDDCERCNAMFKFYCYDCILPVGNITDQIPHVPLPVSCDILYHPTERRSKSTALHAKILSPELVSVHTFPDLPDYNPDEVFLLYPSKDAKNIEDIDVSKMKKLVVIDSTWQKAKTILRDERVSKLPCVKINSQKTLFWRYQTVGENCLATIEAIYYFYREYYQKQLGTYNGQYDDLLFFYTYMYNLIQNTYKQQNKKFKRIDGWLKE